MWWWWSCATFFEHIWEPTFPGGSGSKESACSVGDLGLIPGLGRSSGEGNSNHSSILAWRIPRTEERGGLQSMGSQRVRHDWSDSAHVQTYMQALSQAVKAAWASKLTDIPVLRELAVQWKWVTKIRQLWVHIVVNKNCTGEGHEVDRPRYIWGKGQCSWSEE